MSGARATDERRDRAGTTYRVSTETCGTIDRFHRSFINAGLELRFESPGRPPQSYYPNYRELMLAGSSRARREASCRRRRRSSSSGRSRPAISSCRSSATSPARKHCRPFRESARSAGVNRCPPSTHRTWSSTSPGPARWNRFVENLAHNAPDAPCRGHQVGVRTVQWRELVGRPSGSGGPSCRCQAAELRTRPGARRPVGSRRSDAAALGSARRAAASDRTPAPRR